MQIVFQLSFNLNEKASTCYKHAAIKIVRGIFVTLLYIFYQIHQRFILSIKSYFSTSYEKGEIYYKDLFSVKFSTFSHLQLIIKIIIILSVKLIVKIILYVKRATLFYQIYLVKKLISAEMSSLI